MFKSCLVLTLCSTIGLIVCTTDDGLYKIKDADLYPQFPLICHDGMVVDEKRVCDGIMDCSDGTDESMDLCKDWICHPDLGFKCVSDGRCLRNETVCDGKRSCFDFSDEGSILCQKWKCDPKVPFKCKIDGKCIRLDSVCDGGLDCYDHSDEFPELCLTWPCPSTIPFKCQQDGQCISLSKVCDGYENCEDGSDEGVHACLIKKAEETAAKIRNSENDTETNMPNKMETIEFKQKKTKINESKQDMTLGGLYMA